MDSQRRQRAKRRRKSRRTRPTQPAESSRVVLGHDGGALGPSLRSLTALRVTTVVTFVRTCNREVQPTDRPRQPTQTGWSSATTKPHGAQALRAVTSRRVLHPG